MRMLTRSPSSERASLPASGLRRPQALRSPPPPAGAAAAWDAKAVAPCALGTVIQTKLTVGGSADSCEQEADGIADLVMSMQPSGKQERSCACATPSAPGVRAKSTAADGSIAAPSIVEEVLRSPGEPLDPVARAFMEPRFGYDFSGVRVHTGPAAALSARAIGARAYTAGGDVVFGDGEFASGTDKGRRLIAHELAHVVQQGRAGPFQGGVSAAVASGTLSVSRLAPQTMIHRLAVWKDPAESEVRKINNLAVQVLAGLSGGDTQPMLNGTIVTGASQARTLFKAPELKISTGSHGEYYAQVNRIKVNEGSVRETVAAMGPWTTSTPKAELAQYNGMQTCSGPGNATFTVTGSHGDQDLFEANRRHEDHHVADDRALFRKHVQTWDDNLIVAQIAESNYPGKSPAEAEAALYANEGGTLDEMLDAWVADITQTGRDFHGGPGGGDIVQDRSQTPTVNADCSVVSVKYVIDH
jgi:hypothetical protein